MAQRGMYSRGVKLIRRLLWIILATLLGLEISLSLTDPLGVWPVQQVAYFEAHMQGGLLYRPWPGRYDFGFWQASINAEGQRDVPDSGQGCRVVFVGDSVTFGWGVDDAKTFVNLLAQDMPQIETVNAGQIGYNSTQVRETLVGSEYDLAVYLIISNDPAPPLYFDGPPSPSAIYYAPGFGWAHGGPSALGAYTLMVAHLLELRDVPVLQRQGVDLGRFGDDLGAIATMPHVLLLAFRDAVGEWAAHVGPVHYLNRYHTTVSATDAHPDTAGHRWLAQQILPIIQTENLCPT